MRCLSIRGGSSRAAAVGALLAWGISACGAAGARQPCATAETPTLSPALVSTPDPLPFPARGLPAAVDSPVLVLNVPACRLEVREGDSLVRVYPVAVGTSRYPTPTGRFAVTRVVWNPWWIPPPSDWARKEKPTPPGPNNPMGRVKIYFRDLYFLHGTPAVQSLGHPASHGCVRLSNQDALELARWVHRHGNPHEPGSRFDILETDFTATTTVALGRSIPLRVEYELAEVRGDTLHLYPDVYRRGGLREAALRALEARGIEAGSIDLDRLAAAVARVRSDAVAVPLADLRRDS